MMAQSTLYTGRGGRSAGADNWSAPQLARRGGVLAMVMAGGQGERLRPLTEHRAKAAVPFGGMFRLVDFVLANLVNSGIRDIALLIQYQAQSVVDYLGQGWSLTPSPLRLRLRPPEANGRSWYRGTADAVFQNADLIRSQDPELVLVFGADHVYTMDVRAMIDWHLKNRAEVTVSTVPFPIGEAAQFGTAGIGPDWRIREFLEKQSSPYPIPGRLGQALVSMGNYVFNADVLLEALAEDAGRTDSRHDFGRDIIPRLCSRRRVFAYDFRTNVIPGLEGPTDYWRDVGTIQSFHQANLDLINPFSRLNFSSSRWPLRPRRSTEPPARLISRLYGDFGIVKNSLVAASAVIDGGFVRDSVIGPQVRVQSGAIVEESVILGQTIIKERARVRRAIIDRGNVIEEEDKIGFDLRSDLSRFHVDDSSGIVVVPLAEYSQGLELWPAWPEPAMQSALRM